MNKLEVGKTYTNGKLSREITKIDNGEIYYKTEKGKEKQCWITTFADWVVVNKPSDAEIELDNFIKENSGHWDLTDTKEFIIEYKNELIEIIKKL